MAGGVGSFSAGIKSVETKREAPGLRPGPLFLLELQEHQSCESEQQRQVCRAESNRERMLPADKRATAEAPAKGAARRIVSPTACRGISPRLAALGSCTPTAVEAAIAEALAPIKAAATEAAAAVRAAMASFGKATARRAAAAQPFPAHPAVQHHPDVERGREGEPAGGKRPKAARRPAT